MITENLFQQDDDAEQNSPRIPLRSLPRAKAPAGTEVRLLERAAAEHLDLAARLAQLPRATAHPDFEKRLMRRIRGAGTPPGRLARTAGPVAAALVILGATGTGYLLYTNNSPEPSQREMQPPPAALPAAPLPQAPTPPAPAPGTPAAPPQAGSRPDAARDNVKVTATPRTKNRVRSLRKKGLIRPVPGHATTGGHGSFLNKNPKPQNHSRKPRA